MRVALPILVGAMVGLVGAPSRALGPLEKNHPLVDEGMEAYEAGDFERALQRFELAKKELPHSVVVDYNRGNALFKLGRYEEAREAFRRVGDAAEGGLKARDQYNLGNTLAMMGDEQAAIAAYRRALRLDPQDRWARHNLEVLLRKLPPKSQAPDGGTSSDGGRDGGRGDGGRPDGGGADGGSQDGGRTGDGGTQGADGGRSADGGRGSTGGDGGRPDGGREQPEKSRADGGSERGSDAGSQSERLPEDGGTPESRQPDGGTGARMSRDQAEKLLDSAKNSEKNLQLWRFQQKRPKVPDEKDW